MGIIEATVIALKVVAAGAIFFTISVVVGALGAWLMGASVQGRVDTNDGGPGSN